jgi:hypothetical protein
MANPELRPVLGDACGDTDRVVFAIDTIPDITGILNLDG